MFRKQSEYEFSVKWEIISSLQESITSKGNTTHLNELDEEIINLNEKLKVQDEEYK